MLIVNGVVQDLAPVNSRGFLFGDGVFTTAKVIAGQVLLQDKHSSRLINDAKALSIKPPDLNSLFDCLNTYIAGQTGVLRISITRGQTGRGYSYRGQKQADWSAWFVANDFQTTNDDFKVIWCKTRLSAFHPLAGIKHMNRLEQVLARNEWMDSDIHDGLVMDANDTVIESTCANLFCVNHKKDGLEVSTPLINSNGVNGITRNVFIQLLSKHGVTVKETELSQSDVESSDELMLTNALWGIQPISQLAQKRYSTQIGNQYKTWYEKHIMPSNS